MKLQNLVVIFHQAPRMLAIFHSMPPEIQIKLLMGNNQLSLACRFHLSDALKSQIFWGCSLLPKLRANSKNLNAWLICFLFVPGPCYIHRGPAQVVVHRSLRSIFFFFFFFFFTLLVLNLDGAMIFFNLANNNLM